MTEPTSSASPSRPRAVRATIGGMTSLQPGWMVFAGDPSEVADRLILLHSQVGHSRHIIQMDVGMPHREFLSAIELLGTEVAPRVRAAIS